ncbi:hypothetical protein DL766_007949 [Monosporascus sp. MC13-8B]|uniref:Uncharacterized protein n=1 Tax=Monosporascus cannonballus TaxID=155416 RepID=A0ABY0H1I4_9PEZI|nr:hypothetical protein DL762_006612 [Monosporascus cannonballus]RYO93457.1 hypothetical protein DL763_004360 [Monosporascus cannonballus]RYP21411.1 hypothetical protein DL766_007949 [Monosporascus sp. MC13-8B]
MAPPTTSESAPLSEAENTLLRDVLGAADRAGKLINEACPQDTAEFRTLLGGIYRLACRQCFPRDVPTKAGELFQIIFDKVAEHIEKAKDFDALYLRREGQRQQRIAQDYLKMKGGELSSAWHGLARAKLLEDAMMAYVGHLTLQNKVASAAQDYVQAEPLLQMMQKYTALWTELAGRQELRRFEGDEIPRLGL